jgi:predicted enzyme related to lactoylglutathione lyase
MTTQTATFAFTKLVVDDLDATLAFYADLCGAREVQRIQADIAGEPIEEIICTTESGAGIIFLKWLQRSSTPGGEVVLGFMTADIKELFERATAAGGRVLQEPAALPEMGGVVFGFLADPEGHIVEVVEQG